MTRAKLDEIRNGTYSLDSISAVYSQNADTADDPDNFQVIKIETVSNGVGSYINISLPEGGHWSIDDPNELIDLLKDFQSRYEQYEYHPITNNPTI